MANYIIIGGDSKEYGPVSEADVRQWIAEGRLNAESRMKAESDAEFRALALFPEFADALKPQAPPGSIAPSETAKDLLARDYELDIGDCIMRGWDLYKANFGTLFGSFLVSILVYMSSAGVLSLLLHPINKHLLDLPVGVQLGYNVFFSAVLSLVMGPLMGGLFRVYLKTIRRTPTGIGELFIGFQQAFVQLSLGSLMVTLISWVCMLPFQYTFQVKTGPFLQQMQHMENDPAGMQNMLPQLMPQLASAFASTLPILLICMVPVTFFTICLQFTVPLIIDKQMAFNVAMRTSWHMVMKHWWYVFGLTVLVGLVSALGIFACCIGLIFTLPIGIAALMFAYETIFGSPKN